MNTNKSVNVMIVKSKVNNNGFEKSIVDRVAASECDEMPSGLVHLCAEVRNA